MKLST